MENAFASCDNDSFVMDNVCSKLKHDSIIFLAEVNTKVYTCYSTLKHAPTVPIIIVHPPFNTEVDISTCNKRAMLKLKISLWIKSRISDIAKKTNNEYYILER